MSEDKPLHLKDIKTQNRVGILGKNAWGVILEDGRLIVEVKMDDQIGFTDSNNRAYAGIPGKDLIKQAPTGDEDIERVLNLNIYKKRRCLYCGKKIDKEERARHLDRDVHDACWPNYLETHPELKQPKEEEIDE